MPSNYVYNHIGHFAAVGEALCKSLLLGGVTRRFPELRPVLARLDRGVAGLEEVRDAEHPVVSESWPDGVEHLIDAAE